MCKIIGMRLIYCDYYTAIGAVVVTGVYYRDFHWEVLCYLISHSRFFDSDYSQDTPARYFHVEDVFTFLCSFNYCSTGALPWP